MGRRCTGCSPRVCRDGYLYVVINALTGHVKIGATVRPKRRLSQYRANMADHFHMVHVRRAGCEISSWGRETRALTLLDRHAKRVGGDWFEASTKVAIECVEHACEAIIR